MPQPLKRGVSTSSFFTTWLDEEYQIDLSYLPLDRPPLELDWEIVDRRGIVAGGAGVPKIGLDRGSERAVSLAWVQSQGLWLASKTEKQINRRSFATLRMTL